MGKRVNPRRSCIMQSVDVRVLFLDTFSHGTRSSLVSFTLVNLSQPGKNQYLAGSYP